MTSEELSFSVFCIESVAERLGLPGNKVYDMLTEDSDILYQYIVLCYEPLHTQSRQYIVDEICSVLNERGIAV